jgi:hypothetical protein
MQKTTSQTSKPLPEVKPVEVEEEDVVENDYVEEEETPKVPERKAGEKQEAKPMAIDLQTQIELLHNDGRYRAEMLYQMQEINKALVVIAGILVDKLK